MNRQDVMINNKAMRKRISRDEHDFVKTEVSGQERYEAKERMTRFFSRLVVMDCSRGPRARWTDSVSRLMEVAWVLSKWHAVADAATGRPMTMKAIAVRLCRSLGVRLPANVSSEAHRSLRSGRESVVDYYARLWREHHYDIGATLDWPEPEAVAQGA